MSFFFFENRKIFICLFLINITIADIKQKVFRFVEKKKVFLINEISPEKNYIEIIYY